MYVYAKVFYNLYYGSFLNRVKFLSGNFDKELNNEYNICGVEQKEDYNMINLKGCKEF